MIGVAPSRELHWMDQGHQYLMSCLDLIGDRRLEGPSALPGWSGRHVLSHVGHNARALGRLACWAATGNPVPMYPSPSARAEEIDSGAGWPVPRLRAFVDEEQHRLADVLGKIDGDRWRAEVVTAQGRTLPASTIPWLRSRELWIHACDLPYGGDFAAMPDDFVDALISDALTRRRTLHAVDVRVRATDRDTGAEQDSRATTCVLGAAADVVRWLTGRGTSPRLRTAIGADVPELPPWL